MKMKEGTTTSGERTIDDATRESLSAFCPRYHRAIELIGRRWSGAILRVLLSGRHRFTEIAATIPGVSDRLIAERLRELEAAHVVKRRVVPGPPVRVDYELTPQGEELRLVIADVALWAEKWLPLEEAGGIQAPSSAAGV
jgi:DNA-binding HxlR family transcriptional regulator